MSFRIPASASVGNTEASWLSEFSGGAFLSQVPEDAQARIENADDELTIRLQKAASTQAGMQYQFKRDGRALLVQAKGKSAHSMNPEQGVNAITHLAALLATETWPNSTAAQAIHFINERIGTGYYGEHFGELAYRHDFMGPLSVSLGTVKPNKEGIDIGINLRRPVGKSAALFEQQIRAALDSWQQRHDIKLRDLKLVIGDPYYPADAPQTPTLLQVFSHYTGIANPQPLSIGGGTNAKQLPNAVNFGPAMPGVDYTGHSEHEFITVEQIRLNLRMYTAAMAILAGP